MPKLAETAAASVAICTECRLLGLMEHWTRVHPPVLLALIHTLDVKGSVQ